MQALPQWPWKELGLTPFTSTLPPGRLPAPVPGGRGKRNTSPFQVAVGRVFLFLFLLPFV